MGANAWIETHPRLASTGLLVVINAIVVWPLFFVEYLDYPGSIEGLFVSLVRHYRDHWNDLLWYPYWSAGMPSSATYQPLLHAFGGVVAGASGLSPARAFHIAVGVLYVLGPVTLFLFLRRLLGSMGYALAGGLLYSLVSPSHVLVSAIREDTGWLWGARRLYAALAWGDSPHVTSLTFLPLALLGVDLFVRDKRLGYLPLAAGGIALVFLTNIPGTLALLMGLAGLWIALPARAWFLGAVRIAASGALAYGLCAFLVPPSVLLLVQENVQRMAPDGSADGRTLGVALMAAGLLAIRAALSKAEFPVRLGACFTWIVASVTLGKYWFDVTLLEQPQRFQMALEMATVVLLIGSAGMALSRSERLERVGGVILAAFCAVQLWNYSTFARSTIRPLQMAERSEYKTARWLDDHAGGRRVYVPGATAYWLNAFTETPQLTGCCSQNRLLEAVTIADYVIGTDDGAGDRAVEISTLWLQSLGVGYVAVAGPESTEPHKTIHNWQKFEGQFEAVWRDGDDIIYRTPGPERSLAHAVRPEELVSQMPENGIDVEPLRSYAAAVTDVARPALSLNWRSLHEAVIEGTIPAGMAVSVQTPYHPGWRAEQDGQALRIRADALGMLVIEPQRSGAAGIELTFTGGRELAVARVVSLLAAALALALLAAFWRKGRAAPVR